mgnify:CR=1 FL=1
MKKTSPLMKILPIAVLAAVLQIVNACIQLVATILEKIK